MKNESILDHPTISERLFYPWTRRFHDPYFVKGKAGELGCWYDRSFPDAPTIIHFHGNGETVADYLNDFVDEIAELEVNLLLAEYRGYGMSDGEPCLAAMLVDIPAIVAASDVEPSRLVFFGRSLGSLFATHAAFLYPEAAGLVLESGIADPLERILLRVEPWQLDTTLDAMEAEIDRVLNQRQKLAAFRGRTLVMHTRNDGIVPFNHGVLLHDWANEPKQLVVFEQGDHNTIMCENLEQYFEHLGSFIAAMGK